LFAVEFRKNCAIVCFIFANSASFPRAFFVLGVSVIPGTFAAFRKQKRASTAGQIRGIGKMYKRKQSIPMVLLTKPLAFAFYLSPHFKT
jgi:hypothetical protein